MIHCELQVETPHQFLLKYAEASFKAGERLKIENLVQTAWAFVNDSLVTTLCLQWEPEVIAIAMIRLAVRALKVDLPVS